MYPFNITFRFKILMLNSTSISLMFPLIFTLFAFFRKKVEIRKKNKKNKQEKDENGEELGFKNEEHKKVKFKAIIIEQPELNREESASSGDRSKKESFLIPVKIKNQIEKIVLKILYEKKSVETLKLLIDKVLEYAANQRITVSEKVINLIINQMNKTGRIEFTQKQGWKIKI